jgi:hypothetical protein
LLAPILYAIKHHKGAFASSSKSKKNDDLLIVMLWAAILFFPTLSQNKFIRNHTNNDYVIFIFSKKFDHAAIASHNKFLLFKTILLLNKAIKN